MSLQQLSLRPGYIRVASFVFGTSYTSRCGIRYSSTAPATVVDRSFWRNLVPKPLRKENRQLREKSKEWNPATFFIAIFLLIGSMSIQMITLRNSFDRYMRQSEARIASLREVVEKIQRGEPVNVEAALGTGDPAKEADWEQMLKAIERDEAIRKSKREKPERREPASITSSTSTQNAETVKSAPTNARPGSLGNFI